MSTGSLFDALRHALLAKGFESPAVGIDLGTTKSCIAVARVEDGEIVCRCLPVPEIGQPAGEFAMPSVVAIRDGSLVVGHAARRLARNPGFLQHRRSFSETKNEMGLRCTYSGAPEGFRTATDIAGVVLDRLVERSGVQDDETPEYWVITVPASFHGAQRTATLEAAARSQWSVDAEVSLLDEPYAAMLDLLFRRPEVLAQGLADSTHCLIFDFGGGTCDVALFELDESDRTSLAPRLRGTSRYHRIGGGDIDRAIVYGHLLPNLLSRYGIGRAEVSFRDKRRVFEPALSHIAEQLKLALCRRLRALESNGCDDSAVEVVATGDVCITWQGRELWLSDPALSREQFEHILEPFLNPHPGMSLSDEYVERESVFTPIIQTLFRAHLEPEDIGLVILAGSSSLIPQVRRALATFFPEARLEELGDARAMQAGVARGASLQALALAATGKPLISQVCSSEIALRTRQGLLTLVPSGAALPCASYEPLWLSAPQTRVDHPVDLAIEVLADEGKRTVGRSVWQLEAPVQAGERLALRWTLDANQCLALRLDRIDANEEAEVFEERFDAPLTHIDQQQVARCRMLEAAEAVRNGLVPREALSDTFTRMAQDANRLGQTERALHFVSNAIAHGKPTFHLLNLRAICLENLGDDARAEEVYREAAEWSVARFNLALFLHKRKRHEEALAQIERVLESGGDPAAYVLKGDILAAMGQTQASRLHYQEGLSRATEPESQSPWVLGWLARGARQLGQDQFVERLNAARTQQVKAEEDAYLQGAPWPDRLQDADQRSRAA
ncbi:MAG: tetratricopeptide repeat protein [Xanthomonadales bacterium]|nr:tetratricopeptide repeat protein [Xanthomonadales bacterium]